MVGIAFSIGFIVGPMTGAAFTLWGLNRTGNWWLWPAMFALTLSLVNIGFIAVFLKESLPQVIDHSTSYNTCIFFNDYSYHCVEQEGKVDPTFAGVESSQSGFPVQFQNG